MNVGKRANGSTKGKTMSQDLEKIARQIRIDIIESLAAAGSGHPGGSLSCADMLTVLYFEKMNVNPERPVDPDRDRLVLSKARSSSVCARWTPTCRVTPT